MKTTHMVLLLIGFAAVAVVTAWLVWGTIRPHGAIKSWPEVASRLGLTHKPFEVSTAAHPGTMFGTFDGYQVEITAREQYNRNAQMLLTVRLKRPLGIGLKLGTNVYLQAERGEQLSPFSTGNQDLDAVFRPHARDVDAARRLLGSPEVQEKLLRLVARGGNMGLDDESLVCVADELVTSASGIEDALRRAVAVARAVDEAER